MVDIREKIGHGLQQTVIPNVKMSKPDGDVTLPLICYAESGNTTTDNTSIQRISYRIAIYASTFEELVDLSLKVDDLMVTTFGFERTGKSGDGEARIGTDLYLMRLDYSCNYSLIYNMILRKM